MRKGTIPGTNEEKHSVAPSGFVPTFPDRRDGSFFKGEESFVVVHTFDANYGRV